MNVEQAKHLDGFLYDGPTSDERHRVLSDAEGNPAALCGYRPASHWMLDQERSPTLTCVKCKRLDRARANPPANAIDMQALFDVCREVCQLAPLNATLAEQKLVVARFREVVAKLPKRYVAPEQRGAKLLDELEQLVRDDFEEPITFEDVFGAIEEVRGAR